MAATLKLAVEKGFQATSTAAIAEEANVGMGTIYRYFPSKEDLFSKLFDHLRDKFIRIIVDNYNFSIDPYSNFRNLVFVLVTYYVENVYEFKYLERYSEPSLQIDKRLDETTKLIEPVAQMMEGVDHGFKFKPLPPLVLFAMTYGPLVAIVNLVHMDKIELNDALINDIAESIWNSILEE